MLELSHVSKKFGTRTVVDDLSFFVPDDTVFGFVGENGAGKTTTMKMILGLLRMDAGEIRVDGAPVRFGRSDTNRLVGYLPDVPEFYNFLTPKEYLLLCGEVSGISGKEGRKRAEELLELVGLPRTKQRIQGFSRGMKQRLGIAQALFGNPRLLICDEPTSALDPAGRREILELLHSLKNRATVLFSTHILSDVERICDECAVLHAGRLIRQGALSKLRGDGEQGFLVEFLRPEDAAGFAAALPGGTRTDAVTIEYAQGGEGMRKALGLLAEKGLAVRRVEQKERTLEEMFFDRGDKKEQGDFQKDIESSSVQGNSLKGKRYAGKESAEARQGGDSK